MGLFQVLPRVVSVLLCSDVLEVFHKRWPNEYGDIYRVFVGTKAYVVVSSCELAEVTAPTNDCHHAIQFSTHCLL